MTTFRHMRSLRRTLRHSLSAFHARFWEEPLDDGHHPSACGGRAEHEVQALVREQLHRLVPPKSRPARLAFLERGDNLRCVETLRSRADMICDHRVAVFGNVYEYGQTINWHRDPVSGYEWPLIPSYRIDLWNTEGLADIRFVWELSAFRHGVVLGQAYWLTHEEKYARELIAQVRHWACHNPLNRGANWQCAMMVAIRAANLVWAYAFLVDSPLLDGADRRFLYNLLRLHGLHIFNNLENTSSIRGNHYLGDLAGLVHLSCVLPVATEARTWFDFAVRELTREVDTQILPDGLDFEGSLPYHGLVAEMLLHTGIVVARLGPSILKPAVPSGLPSLTLRQQSGLFLGDRMVNTVERMLDAAACYTTPDGSVPQIGDNDGSRWVALWDKPGLECNDRHLFAIAGEYFDRDDFRQLGEPARGEAVWLFDDIPKGSSRSGWVPRSHLFRESGICTMRNGGDYLIARCGALGTAGKGTHTHNDNLSFELRVAGQPYLVDPGSFTYLRNPELRNMFRSTAYHNTLRIDGLEQHQSCARDLFQLLPASEAVILDWESNDECDVFRGQVRMCGRGAGGILHQREFRYSRAEHRWGLTDELVGQGLHTLEWFFHLYPGVRAEHSGDTIVLHGGGRGAITLKGDLVERGVVELRDGWYSPGYDQKASAPILYIVKNMMLPIRACLTIESLPPGASVIPDMPHEPAAVCKSEPAEQELL